MSNKRPRTNISNEGQRDEGQRDEGMASGEILDVIREITNAKMTTQEKQRMFRAKFPQFRERYPVLFEMACEPHFDYAKLEYLMNLRNNVRDGKVSVETASKEVGQTMFDEYVQPLVDSKNAKK